MPKKNSDINRGNVKFSNTKKDGAIAKAKAWMATTMPDLECVLNPESCDEDEPEPSGYVRSLMRYNLTHHRIKTSPDTIQAKLTIHASKSVQGAHELNTCQ